MKGKNALARFAGLKDYSEVYDILYEVSPSFRKYVDTLSEKFKIPKNVVIKSYISQNFFETVVRGFAGYEDSSD